MECPPAYPPAIGLEVKGDKYVRLALGLVSVGGTWSSAGANSPSFPPIQKLGMARRKFFSSSNQPTTTQSRKDNLARWEYPHYLRLQAFCESQCEIY